MPRAGVLLVVAAVAGCGGPAAGTERATTAIDCRPARATPRAAALRLPRGPAAVSIPATPTGIVLCGYDGSGVNEPHGGVILGPGDAGPLVDLIDNVPATRPRRTACGAFADGTTLVIAYASAPPVRVAIYDRMCGGSVAVVAGRAFAFDVSLANTLAFDAAVSSSSAAGRPAPETSGLAAPAACAAARRAGLDFAVAGEAVDPAAPFGTVVFQTPAPGTVSEIPTAQLRVTLAVAPAPACRAGQLALAHYGGGPATGNDFGDIGLRDVSSAPCRLTGPIRVAGLDRRRRRVTPTLTSRVTGPAILSPRAVAAHAPTGQLVGSIALSAEYRDDPTSPDGSCRIHLITPASWQVTVPGGPPQHVRNHDSTDNYAEFRSGLRTCRGNARAGPAEIAAAD